MTTNRRDFLKIASSIFGTLMLAPKEAAALLGDDPQGVVVMAHTKEGRTFIMQFTKEIQEACKFTFVAALGTEPIGTFYRFTLSLFGRQVGDRRIDPICKGDGDTLKLTWNFTIEEGDSDRWRVGGYTKEQQRRRLL